MPRNLVKTNRQIRAAWRKSNTDADAARHLGVSQSTFYQRRVLLGLPNCHDARLDEWWAANKANFLLRWGVRSTQEWLASDIGITPQRLDKILAHFAIPSVYAPIGEKLEFLEKKSHLAYAVAAGYNYRASTRVGAARDDFSLADCELLIKPSRSRSSIVSTPPRRHAVLPRAGKAAATLVEGPLRPH